MKLVYFCAATGGGMADYARYQANALVAQGVDIEFLAPARFPARSSDQFSINKLRCVYPMQWPRPFRTFAAGLRILQAHRTLAEITAREKAQHVLMASYAEYLAPLWSSPLRSLARSGTVFGAIVHDPVRDHVVGPRWWHRRSIAAGYSFLREAFVHEDIHLDTSAPMSALRTTVIPHGPYPLMDRGDSRQQVRTNLNLPESAFVWLSFGHLRQGKNLHLSIPALRDFPNAFLVVAGRAQSGGQQIIEHYRRLAREAGVADRCRWVDRFVPEEEVGGLFRAADLVLLTYSRSFRSASGVLNAAVAFRRPCVASGGEGNLQTQVKRHSLGVWVEPDDALALRHGIRRFFAVPPAPHWEAYEEENSWQINARRVVECMSESR